MVSLKIIGSGKISEIWIPTGIYNNSPVQLQLVKYLRVCELWALNKI